MGTSLIKRINGEHEAADDHPYDYLGGVPTTLGRPADGSPARPR